MFLIMRVVLEDASAAGEAFKVGSGGAFFGLQFSFGGGGGGGGLALALRRRGGRRFFSVFLGVWWW